MIRTRKGPLVHIDTCDKCPFRALDDDAKMYRCSAPTYFGNEALLLGPLVASGEEDPPPTCNLRKSQVMVLVGPYEEAPRKKGKSASKS